MTQRIDISGPLLTLKQEECMGPYEVIIDFEATNDPDTLEKLKELGMSRGWGSYNMSYGTLEITIPTKYGDMFFDERLEDRFGFVSYGVTIGMDTMDTRRSKSKVDGHLTIRTSTPDIKGGYGKPQTITFSSVGMDFRIYVEMDFEIDD